jgi:hypothetical protein
MNHWIAFVAACWLVGCASTGNVRVPNDAPDAARAGCVNQSGSLIPQTRGACAGLGHTYSRADIDHTGATTVGEALRLLDPTITVSR